MHVDEPSHGPVTTEGIEPITRFVYMHSVFLMSGYIVSWTPGIRYALFYFVFMLLMLYHFPIRIAASDFSIYFVHNFP